MAQGRALKRVRRFPGTPILRVESVQFQDATYIFVRSGNSHQSRSHRARPRDKHLPISESNNLQFAVRTRLLFSQYRHVFARGWIYRRILGAQSYWFDKNISNDTKYHERAVHRIEASAIKSSTKPVKRARATGISRRRRGILIEPVRLSAENAPINPAPSEYMPVLRKK